MSALPFPVVLVSPVNDAKDRFASVLLQWAASVPEQHLQAVQAALLDSGLAQAHPKLSYYLPLAAQESLAAQPAFTAGLRLEFADQLDAPAIAQPKSATSASTLLLKLLGQITSDAETRDIEDTLKRDPQLSVQLLRLVNSVSFSLKEPVTSFGQAINILGRRQLQRWLQLLMFASQNAPGYGRPLMVRAAMRGATMEQLTKLGGGSASAQDAAFLTGMFSLLDLLFGKPLADIVLPLKLGDEINSALLQQEGAIGGLLQLVVAAEQRDLAAVTTLLARQAIDRVRWCTAQITALQWTLGIGSDE